MRLTRMLERRLTKASSMLMWVQLKKMRLELRTRRIVGAKATVWVQRLHCRSAGMGATRSVP
jgi:hypothetical protein